ncbi:MAG: CPBP family intramembrane metalloprotease [Melioribacteraceae bacterium]|nr:CPBP family intramembrane metalloprotease [Melioribacteraceae bacterium]
MNTLSKIFINPRENRVYPVWTVIASTVIVYILAFELLPASLNFIPNDYVFNLFFEIALFVVVVPMIYLFARFADKRNLTDLGLSLNSDWLKDFGGGMLIGTIIIVIVFVTEYSLGWVKVTGYFYSRNNLNFGMELLGRFFGYFLVAYMEEIFSRGYLIKNIAEGFSHRFSAKQSVMFALIISSIIFGVLHGANPNSSFISSLNLIFIGGLYGYSYLMRGSLAFPIGVHFMWNFVEGNMFGFPVSGFQPEVSVLSIEQLGSEYWTGGQFGPEAGALIFPALICGFFMTRMWFRMRLGSAKRNLNIAYYERTTP